MHSPIYKSEYNIISNFKFLEVCSLGKINFDLKTIPLRNCLRKE